MQEMISPFGGYKTISPFVMVIFGATGDLTARKLMPALYNLLDQGILPDRFFIVGVGRRGHFFFFIFLYFLKKK